MRWSKLERLIGKFLFVSGLLSFAGTGALRCEEGTVPKKQEGA
jgi:hypothetical protein